MQKTGKNSIKSSIEPLFNKKSGKPINSYNDDNLNNKNKKGKTKKNDLIYNNSYLFKENENYDDNKSNLLIKKEIQDILNTDYGRIPINIVNTSIFISSRRKIENIGKRKYVKRKTNRQFLKIDDELLNEELLLKNKRLYEESEQQKKLEKMRDKKIYDFFAKIQKLKKKGLSNNFNDELNSFIDQQIEQNNQIPKEKNGGRLNVFLQEFLSNRIRAKYNSNLKNKRFGFLSPVIFTSPNDTYIFNKSVNLYKK